MDATTKRTWAIQANWWLNLDRAELTIRHLVRKRGVFKSRVEHQVTLQEVSDPAVSWQTRENVNVVTAVIRLLASFAGSDVEYDGAFSERMSRARIAVFSSERLKFTLSPAAVAELDNVHAALDAVARRWE